MRCIAVLLVLASLAGCEGQGNTPAETVTVTWGVNGPAGKTVLIETYPGHATRVPMTKQGASGRLKVPAGKEAKIWADLSSGETLTCVLTDRTGFSAIDSGTGHCQTKLKTRLTPDK